GASDLLDRYVLPRGEQLRLYDARGLVMRPCLLRTPLEELVRDGLEGPHFFTRLALAAAIARVLAPRHHLDHVARFVARLAELVFRIRADRVADELPAEP